MCYLFCIEPTLEFHNKKKMSSFNLKLLKRYFESLLKRYIMQLDCKSNRSKGKQGSSPVREALLWEGSKKIG